MRKKQLFDLIKPRYEAAYIKANGVPVKSLIFKRGFVYLTTKENGDSPMVLNVNDLEHMVSGLNMLVPKAEKDAREAAERAGIPKLEDNGFYWVKFSKDEIMEVARYRENIDRFKFTNGSQCEPSRMFFIDPRKLDYALMPEGLIS